MTQQELLKKIEEVQLTGLTTLDLSGNGLTEVPKEIVQLTNLTTLTLGHNSLTEVPKEIAQLTNLTRLDLGHNSLTEVPKEIALLTNLTTLDLSGNGLTEVPKEIALLTKLTELNLTRNGLTEVPKEIAQLTNLTTLYLGHNSLTELPDNITKFTTVNLLYLHANKLSIFPKELDQLTNLTTLTLAENGLTEVPKEIALLTNLTRLDLSGNGLTEVPKEIAQLTNLTRLDLGHNSLTEVPKEIALLTNLTRLDLSGNGLTEVPKEIALLTKLTELDLRGNQLSIPPEVLDKPDEPGAILNYILQNQSVPKRRLNEAKVLVVGQGTVGKTSLIKRLMHNTYNPQENKTEGIDIRRWHVDVEGENVCLNVWDFGGQEIMHATHQFFLTKRSLYLLVLDSRQEEAENRLEYWLKIIQSFGSDSPVLIVCNKADQHHIELDRRGLETKYANIKGFVETSCETGKGIVELKAVIAQQIGELKHIHDELPATWFAVKERLEKMPQNYIPASEYQQICQTDRVEDALSQRTLLRFLHDLGIILNYDDDPRLQDTNILNPEWVTNGVYKILNSHQMSEGKGRLQRSMLNQILDPQTYPPAKHEFILEMMRKFELCFDLEEGRRGQTFLIPDLLRKEEIYTGEWEDTLAFRYRYDVLPGSIISRFIVRMNGYILQNTCWRTGVLLSYEDNEALVKADLEDRRITVSIRKGNARTRRELLAIIRKDFKAIHDTITGIKVQERVPVPGQPKIDVDYQHLLLLEDKKEQSYYPEGAKESVSVREMLDGVAPFEERLEQRESYKREDEFRQRREAKRLESESEALVSLQPEPEEIVAPAPTFNHQSLQVAVVSFLSIFVVVMAVLAFLSRVVDKSLVVPVVIGGVLLFILLSAGVLVLIGKLTGQEFTTVIKDVLQQLPLISGGKTTNNTAISGKKTDAKDKTLPKADAKPKVLPPAASTPKQEADDAYKAVVTVQEPKATKAARAKQTDKSER